jgi:DNA replication and repair protein RecF
LALLYFKAENFRLFDTVEFQLHPRYNLIYGDNASGKTSALEAISYLGRGRSFRDAQTKSIVKDGQEDFLLFGQTVNESKQDKLGITNGSSGLALSLNGEHTGGLESLARSLPVQVIDPNIHNLVAGSPENRRRFLDWVVFHVEPSYLKVWRKYKRSLKQRNLLLKNHNNKELRSWNKGFIALGEEINKLRCSVFEVLESAVSQISTSLLDDGVSFHYDRGWPDNQNLEESLIKSETRDIQLKSTQIGPHRADISITYAACRAKKHISRGQQKLLACAMVLGSVEIVQEYMDSPILLLLDDPSAELDNNSLDKLMKEVVAMGPQIIATSIEKHENFFPDEYFVFHVEHGKVKLV